VSSPSDDYQVGYGRPPRRTRWKKGQSGNPSRRYGPRTYGTVEIIDRLLRAPVKIVENDLTRTVSTLEAILLQLWRKELAGDRWALRTRLRYQEFARQTARRRVEVEFVDNDYTRAFAEQPAAIRSDNERR
jgi:hypothetical protein